jgi:heat shock protein HslJ
MNQLITRFTMITLTALIAAGCSSGGAQNLQQAGATADAQLATAGPSMATTRAKAGDAAATAGAAAAPAAATLSTEAGGMVNSVEAKLNERLVARIWQLSDMTDAAGGTTKPGDPSAYTVTFVPGGTVAVKADCKTLGGTFTAADTVMKLDVKVTTTEVCPAGSLADRFVEALGMTASWQVDEKRLTLTLAENAGTLHFVTQ